MGGRARTRERFLWLSEWEEHKGPAWEKAGHSLLLGLGLEQSSTRSRSLALNRSKLSIGAFGSRAPRALWRWWHTGHQPAGSSAPCLPLDSLASSHSDSVPAPTPAPIATRIIRRRRRLIAPKEPARKFRQSDETTQFFATINSSGRYFPLKQTFPWGLSLVTFCFDVSFISFSRNTIVVPINWIDSFLPQKNSFRRSHNFIEPLAFLAQFEWKSKDLLWLLLISGNFISTIPYSVHHILEIHKLRKKKITIDCKVFRSDIPK